ncbi:MAG: hypothetical protein K0S22_1797 [Oscillospiraceae bacterium]|jgi:hypothetical protein|nr:hypothetical protein [Oscillospiraceae bacterium]
MKRTLISIFLAVALVMTGTVTAFALPSATEAQYAKQEYLDIVNELNAQYGAEVSLKFKTSGNYVTASEMPSPQEYRQQLAKILQAQANVKRQMVATEIRVAAAELQAAREPLIQPFADESGSASQVSNFSKIKIKYSATDRTGRYLFASCTSYSFNKVYTFPEYTFVPYTKGADIIDSRRTIYVWGKGDLIYASATYQQVINNARVAADFYISATGKVTSKGY